MGRISVDDEGDDWLPAIGPRTTRAELESLISDCTATAVEDLRRQLADDPDLGADCARILARAVPVIEQRTRNVLEATWARVTSASVLIH